MILDHDPDARGIQLLSLVAGLSVWADEPARFSMRERQVEFVVVNDSKVARDFKLPAGTLWQTTEKARLVSLTAVESTIPPQGKLTAIIPVAAVSSTSAFAEGITVSSIEGTEPKAQPLLDFLATQPNIPRVTSQLALLALLEDIDYAAWQKSPVHPPALGGTSPVTPDLTTALDAITLLRLVAPGRDFALARDSTVKLGSLHDPQLRTKARQLYGLTLPDDLTAATAPDLNQLLHTKPGDNCPICRMRAQMATPADVP